DLGITTDGIDDTIAGLGEYEGDLVGLPVQAESYTLFYNVDAFTAAGITEPPATFDELVQTAAALTTDSQYGIALPGIGGDGSTPVYFLPFLLSAG
ncbi:extracellular solute-binding protein, partial [Escherichia coli]